MTREGDRIETAELIEEGLKHTALVIPPARRTITKSLRWRTRFPSKRMRNRRSRGWPDRPNAPGCRSIEAKANKCKDVEGDDIEEQMIRTMTMMGARCSGTRPIILKPRQDAGTSPISLTAIDAGAGQARRGQKVILRIQKQISEESMHICLHVLHRTPCDPRAHGARCVRTQAQDPISASTQRRHAAPHFIKVFPGTKPIRNG